MTYPKKRLGRGLAALIGDMDQPLDVQAKDRCSRRIGMCRSSSSAETPTIRAVSSTRGDLQDLARSIAQHGIVQPVVVRTKPDGRFEIIAGERRWRAAQRAGLVEIPVIVRDVDDRTALELAIVENVQRSDLNPLDEAMGYEQLIAGHGYTQNDLGDIIGKSRSHVANSLRLLKLPEAVRDMLALGKLTAGHARAIASTSDPVKYASMIASRGLSVRDAERLAQKDSQPAQADRPPVAKDADTLALEKTLSDRLGLKVTIHHRDQGGQIKVDYRSLEQLDELCRLLQAGPIADP